MNVNRLIVAGLLIGSNVYSQSFTSLDASGVNRKIEWVTSGYGKGFGHKIYNDDPGGITLLNIAARHNSDIWVDALTITSEGKIGLGTESPRAKLDVIGGIRTRSLTVDDPLKAIDWNELWQSGFYESYQALNAPEPNSWFWGIVMNHSTNHTEYKFSGQIAVKNNPTQPVMYFRSTNKEGDGVWAKVLNSIGNQVINGKLEAKEIKITTTPTADFVFDNDYDLPSLEYIEKYISENKHLPQIASAEEMKKEGVSVGEFQIKLLQKIEELTLYTIDQEKRIDKYEETLLQLKETVVRQQKFIEKHERNHD